MDLFSSLWAVNFVCFLWWKQDTEMVIQKKKKNIGFVWIVQSWWVRQNQYLIGFFGYCQQKFNNGYNWIFMEQKSFYLHHTFDTETLQLKFCIKNNKL